MAVTVLGHAPELHDRLVGRAGAFGELLRELPGADRATIAVRRANVFHLSAIASFVAEQRGLAVDFVALDPHPVGSIDRRFAEHWREVAKRVELCGVELRLDDRLLEPLLAHVAGEAARAREPDLLRLLGIVCDQALVGPHWFVFEIVNRCNARCLYCNIHAPARRPGAAFLDERMPYEFFARTIEDLARLGVDGVTILANGEPLLHPDFARMIVAARQLGLRVNFFTNGLLLDEAMAETIVAAGVDEMFCTISAATPATYAALHADADERDWNRLLANLRRLFARRRAGKPEAWMVNVICGPNARELPAMVELAADLGFDGLRPQLLRVDEFNRGVALAPDDVAWLRAAQSQVDARCRARGLRLWAPYAFQLRHAGDDPSRWSGDVFWEKGCFIGFALGLAKANGDLSFCCDVKPVANLADGSFAELWSGGLYHQARLAAKDLGAAGGLLLRGGATLAGDACLHCDNHDINRRMHELMDRHGMWRFLGRP
jgi:MoaA/NifB/PqqE/SkfB family radical SAM enzyme